MTSETRGGVGAGSVALAFLGGAVVASVAVLLLAPRSGAETRARIGEAVGHTEEKVRRARMAAAAAAHAAKEAYVEAMKDAH